MQTRSLLGSPSFGIDPAAARDTGVWLVPETVDDGHVTMKLHTGETLSARLTIPTAGVARMRLGASANDRRTELMLLPGLSEEPVRMVAHKGQLLIKGSGLSGQWSTDGADLTIGPLTCSVLPGAAHRVGLAPVPQDESMPQARWIIHLRLAADAAIYGGGASVQGPNLRGRTRRCMNLNTNGVAGLDRSYLNVPFFWSDAGWGIYVNTGSPVLADLGATHSEIAVVAIDDDPLDLFLMTGSPHQVLRRYLALTGLPGTFPEWALGVWTSRASYFSAAEVEEVLEGYETNDCPVDVVHIDAWQQGNLFNDQSCNWEVDRDRWPDGWSRRLKKHKVHVSLWLNSYVRRNTPAGDEAMQMGLVLRDGHGEPVGTDDIPERLIIDFAAPGARRWWQERIIDVVTAEGAEALKTDFGENIPLVARCADGRSGWQMRNGYALDYEQATHEALQMALGSTTVALFSRSGTAGAHRYPCHWVGDTPSTWVGLISALRSCLSLSLSGFAFVGSDIGGFWAQQSMQRSAQAFARFDASAFQADVEPELFVRWTQWGALSPIMRFHGTGLREPWAYPEPYKQAAIAACRLRRHMRTYLVETARVAVHDGMPVMRPMVLAFPDNRAARDANFQYLLGDRVLVAPVLKPGGMVHLWVPPGHWHPLAGAPELQGPGWAKLRLPLTAVPAWTSGPF
jgi:alpha-D-xyloside xylohydrolase